MEPFKKKKSLGRPARFVARLEPMEREVIGDLSATVSEAIIRRAQSAPKDELAEMMGIASGHKDAPSDPSLARLFPDFQKPGDEEFEGDASLLRSMNENDIARAKLGNLQVLNEVLGPNGGVDISLDEQEAHAVVAAFNDIRLFLAAAEAMPAQAAVADKDAVVDWLGFAQDSLLQALMD